MEPSPLWPLVAYLAILLVLMVIVLAASHLSGERHNAPAADDQSSTSVPRQADRHSRVESFNGRMRQECLNANWFMSLEDVRAKIAAWRTYYNESRPHSALDWATPTEFARRCGLQAGSSYF